MLIKGAFALKVNTSANSSNWDHNGSVQNVTDLVFLERSWHLWSQHPAAVCIIRLYDTYALAPNIVWLLQRSHSHNSWWKAPVETVLLILLCPNLMTDMCFVLLNSFGPLWNKSVRSLSSSWIEWFACWLADTMVTRLRCVCVLRSSTSSSGHWQVWADTHAHRLSPNMANKSYPLWTCSFLFLQEFPLPRLVWSFRIFQ